MSWTGTTTSSSAGAGALMNILLQKFAMSTGQLQQGVGEGEGRGGKEGSWKSFSAHFIAFHFAAVTQGLPRGLPKRKLSAQFEILLRQVFPSITQRGVAPAPLSLSLPLLLMLPQVTQGGKPPSALSSAPAPSTAATSHFLLPNPCPAALVRAPRGRVHGRATLWPGNPFAVWRVSAAVVLA